MRWQGHYIYVHRRRKAMRRMQGSGLFWFNSDLFTVFYLSSTIRWRYEFSDLWFSFQPLQSWLLLPSQCSCHEGLIHMRRINYLQLWIGWFTVLLEANAACGCIHVDALTRGFFSLNERGGSVGRLCLEMSLISNGTLRHVRNRFHCESCSQMHWPPLVKCNIHK